MLQLNSMDILPYSIYGMVTGFCTNYFKKHWLNLCLARISIYHQDLLSRQIMSKLGRSMNECSQIFVKSLDSHHLFTSLDSKQSINHVKRRNRPERQLGTFRNRCLRRPPFVSVGTLPMIRPRVPPPPRRVRGGVRPVRSGRREDAQHPLAQRRIAERLLDRHVATAGLAAVHEGTPFAPSRPVAGRQPESLALIPPGFGR
mmetsp:Transcript_7034/g.8715  ORF Transcript_7034/g.8715 Transcript_7034/m.8715 type:complete len:201 (+) Transcript_7034:421-1023(+)